MSIPPRHLMPQVIINVDAPAPPHAAAAHVLQLLLQKIWKPSAMVSPIET